MASIGLLLAADFAGTIPNTNPINVATKKDNKIEFKDKIVSIPVANSKTYAAAMPKTIQLFHLQY